MDKARRPISKYKKRKINESLATDEVEKLYKASVKKNTHQTKDKEHNIVTTVTQMVSNISYVYTI